MNDNGSPHYEPIDGWKSIASSDTGAILSINKDSYTLTDHAEMGNIIEAVLAQPKHLRGERAGTRSPATSLRLDVGLDAADDVGDQMLLTDGVITSRYRARD